MKRTGGWRRRGERRRSGSGWSGIGGSGSCRKQQGGSRDTKRDPMRLKPRSESLPLALPGACPALGDLLALLSGVPLSPPLPSCRQSCSSGPVCAFPAAAVTAVPLKPPQRQWVRRGLASGHTGAGSAPWHSAFGALILLLVPVRPERASLCSC